MRQGASTGGAAPSGPQPCPRPGSLGPIPVLASSGPRISYCADCRGMLVPMDDFRHVLTVMRAVEPPKWDQLHRRRSCPRCGREMETHLPGGAGNVILDTCEGCGVNWLDDGERERIARAPRPC